MNADDLKKHGEALHSMKAVGIGAVGHFHLVMFQGKIIGVGLFLIHRDKCTLAIIEDDQEGSKLIAHFSAYDPFSEEQYRELLKIFQCAFKDKHGAK